MAEMTNGIPDDDHSEIDYGLELRGVYDGVCLWFYKDGTVRNRFTPEWGRQYAIVEDYIRANGLTKRETP